MLIDAHALKSVHRLYMYKHTKPTPLKKNVLHFFLLSHVHSGLLPNIRWLLPEFLPAATVCPRLSSLPPSPLALSGSLFLCWLCYSREGKYAKLQLSGVVAPAAEAFLSLAHQSQSAGAGEAAGKCSQILPQQPSLKNRDFSLPCLWLGLALKASPTGSLSVCLVTPAGRCQWPGCPPGLRAFSLGCGRPLVAGLGMSSEAAEPRLSPLLGLWTAAVRAAAAAAAAAALDKRSNLRQDCCAGEREPAMHWPHYFPSSCLSKQGRRCRRRR